MPALIATGDLSLLDELWHHPVEVVGLDPQFLGDLWNGDPRAAAHQRQRLVCAGVATATTARARRATARGPARGSRGRAGAGAPPAGERVARRLQSCHLISQLAQS